jgi:hypothetical protein
VEELRKKKRIGWNSVHHQNWWFFEFHPRLNANVLFLQVFVESHLVYDQTQGSGAVFLLLYGELYWESGSKVQTIKKIGFESQPWSCFFWKSKLKLDWGYCLCKTVINNIHWLINKVSKLTKVQALSLSDFSGSLKVLASRPFKSASYFVKETSCPLLQWVKNNGFDAFCFIGYGDFVFSIAYFLSFFLH